VPWGFLGGLLVTVVLALSVASVAIARLAGRDAVSAFRDT
jgi:hypothetical protein